MNTMMRGIAAAAALTCVAAAADAAVLNFDDRTGTQAFLAPYAGPDSNLFVFTYIPGPAPCSACSGSWYTSDSPDPFALAGASPLYKSPSTTASTDDGNNGTALVFRQSQPIFANQPIVFDGAYFTSLDAGITVKYHLFLAGTEVFTGPTVALTYGAPSTFVASGYTQPIDSVTVEGYQGYFAMDDFTYTTAAAIPEPSTYALMMLGLGVVGLSAARRSRKG